MSFMHLLLRTWNLLTNYNMDARYTPNGLPILSKAFVNANYGQMGREQVAHLIKKGFQATTENLVLCASVEEARLRWLQNRFFPELDQHREEKQRKSVLHALFPHEYLFRAAAYYYALDVAARERERTPSGMPIVNKKTLEKALTAEDLSLDPRQCPDHSFIGYLSGHDARLFANTKKFARYLPAAFIEGAIESMARLKHSLPPEAMPGATAMLLNIAFRPCFENTYELLRRQLEIYRLEDQLRGS